MLAAKTSTIAGTTIDPSKINDGTKLGFVMVRANSDIVAVGQVAPNVSGPGRALRGE